MLCRDALVSVSVCVLALPGGASLGTVDDAPLGAL